MARDTTRDALAIWQRCHTAATVRAREVAHTWDALKRWHTQGARGAQLRVEESGLVVLDTEALGDDRAAGKAPVTSATFTPLFLRALLEASGDTQLIGFVRHALALDQRVGDRAPGRRTPREAEEDETVEGATVEEIRKLLHAGAVAKATRWVKARIRAEKRRPGDRKGMAPAATQLARRSAWLRVWGHLAGRVLIDGGLPDRCANVAGRLEVDGRRVKGFVVTITQEAARMRRRQMPPKPLRIDRRLPGDTLSLSRARELGFDLGGRFDLRRPLAKVYSRALAACRAEVQTATQRQPAARREEEDYIAVIKRRAPAGLVSVTAWGAPDGVHPEAERRETLDRSPARAARQVRRQLAAAEHAAWRFVRRTAPEGGQRAQLDRYPQQLVAWVLSHGWRELPPFPGAKVRVFKSCIDARRAQDASAALRDNLKAAERLVSGTQRQAMLAD